MRKIIIISRKSPLALWQAEFVKYQLEKTNSEIQCEIKGRLTEGDRLSSISIDSGNKNLFVKDLQQALLNEEADIAVHSIKDMSVHSHPDLVIGAILKRGDPRDVFISNAFSSLNTLPKDAIIGTSSPRRHCQLKHLRPDCQITALRGNIGTRITKLDAEECDAIILAAAGLQRLRLENRITEYFDPNKFIPAIGQGAIGVEYRQNSKIQALIKPLDDRETRICIMAERAVNVELEGNCLTPIGAHAVIKNNQLTLSALVGKLDGSLILQALVTGKPEKAEELGYQAAHELLRQGAGPLLKLT